MTDPFIRNATVVRVIDGDSIVVTVYLGFRLTIEMPVRLAHINAPELNQPGGTEAKQHLAKLLSDDIDLSYIPVTVKTYKPYDKYGRWLAEVFVDERNINQQMIADGHATAYEGVGK